MKALLIISAILLTQIVSCAVTPHQVQGMQWYYQQHQRSKQQNKVDLIGDYQRPTSPEHKAEDYYPNYYPLLGQ